MIEIDGKVFCAALTPELGIDGKWLDQAACARRGIRLIETRTATPGGITRRLTLENGGEGFRLDGFRYRQSGRRGDFLDLPGDRVRLYLGGWTMATPCGARRRGDFDFEFDPEYLRFAVAEPGDYDRSAPDRFRAENVLLIADAERETGLLIGFITTADQSGRFTLRLDDHGVSELSIISGGDGRAVDPGETVSSEEILFLAGTDTEKLLETYAELWGERMHARLGRPGVPTGWCSWYYYFDAVTEKDIHENIDWLARHREEYPLEYIQLDDGYQSALGDWLVTNRKFPHGLGALATRIRAAGFKPALWFGPFMVEESAVLFSEHPEWLIHNPAGEICFPFQWRSGRVAVLDGTHPGVQQHFRDLFRQVRKLGFEYLKLDFLMLASSVRDGVLFDRKATRAQALRRGLAAIREGFGEDGFLLGCTAPLGPVAGLVDGERTSTDITPYWRGEGHCCDEAPTVPNVCRNVINRAYLNHRVWLNDPDTHIARSDNTSLTANEVELWTEAIRLTGGLLLLSDRFETLSPERAALSRRLLAEPDAFECRPLDRLKHTRPEVWLATHRLTGKRILGLFNFEDFERKIECIHGAADVPAHSCRLLEL